jgi:cytidyltransferase-like protein
MINKILNFDGAVEIAQILKSNGKSVGLCHGCFDMLHIGHVRHFNSASKKCDYLFVSITPDQYVNKGPNRPVVNHDDRIQMINSLDFISFCLINKFESAVKLLDELKPTYFFKGVEYKNNPDQINENFLKELKILESNNGQMVFTDDEIRSSTSLFNKLKNK